MQETRILSRINRQKLLSPASASPKHTKFRADVFTILSAFCLVFFVFARYNHTLQRTLGGAAAPIPEKEVCSMRNWFSRHPVSFMAFYLLFYLSAFHWLEVHIAVPDVLVHCHLDDLIPFCKYAIVPYFAWFLWIPFTLFYLLWKAPRADFWRLCLPLFAGMTIALACYVILPTGLDLRPYPGVRQRPLCSGRADALCHRHAPQRLPLHPCVQLRHPDDGLLPQPHL